MARHRNKVVYIEPGREACVKEIGRDLEDLQRAVGGGYIETFYPFSENDDGTSEVIVCNDEGKYNGMLPNRGIRGEDGKVMDIMFGPFFICDCSTENFDSLSPEKQAKYLEMFRYPEMFSIRNGEIDAVQIIPCPMKHHDAER